VHSDHRRLGSRHLTARAALVVGAVLLIRE
jgi:hypothetical protein